MKSKILFLSLGVLFLMSCKCTKKTMNEKVDNDTQETVLEPIKQEVKPIRRGMKQMPPAIVYKTRGDYYDKVPIILSADKKMIVSYPAPTDIYYKGELAYPTKLSKGYLLDNRGINKNVAFTKYTYEEYSLFENLPSQKEFLESIIDFDPLINLVNLGPRIYFEQDEVSEINKIIQTKFEGYKQLND